MPHIHEKIDFTADVFIVHKNKVLLRMHDKYKMWLVPGGHVELDETPDQAALREVEEEVGLKVILVPPRKIPTTNNDDRFTELSPPWYCNIHKINDTHQHISLVYFATTTTDAVMDSINEHERSECRWVSAEELETMDLIPNMKFYAAEALKELGEK